MQSSHRSFFFYLQYISYTQVYVQIGLLDARELAATCWPRQKKKKKKIQNKTYQKYWQQPKRKKESKQEDNTRVKNDCQKRVIAFTEQL